MLFLLTAAVARQPSLLTCHWEELTTSDCAERALALDGAFAATGVPGLRAARLSAFEATARCATSRPELTVERSLPDGSVRRTLGAATRGAAEPLHAPCARAETDVLRAIVEQATRRFALSLEGLVADAAALPGGYSSLREVVGAAEHLEHFHAYLPAHPANATPADALPLHTDAGLFIAIVPAMLFDVDAGSAEGLPAEEGGFFVERTDGVRARLAPALAADSLVFALGDGWNQWVNPALSTGLRVAPHGMRMPPAGGNHTIARLWHGRMVLPPSRARMPDGSDFATWRTRRVSAALRLAAGDDDSSGDDHAQPQGEDLPAGCAGGTELLDTGDCADGEIFCWMRCMPVGDCGAQAQCYDPSTNTPADPHKTCPLCKPDCPHQSGGGCVGIDMEMTGFQWSEWPDGECVIFLLSQFSLDSPIKFRVAFFVTILIGIANEALIAIRRGPCSFDKAGRRSRAVGTIVTVLLFALQSIIAYILMLIAMTYQLQLFLAVITGLAIGHALFNVAYPVSASADPCCVQPVVPKRSTSSYLTHPLLSSTDDSVLRPVLLGIDGMVCDNCVAKVRASLEAVEGVVSVTVNMSANTAEVRGLPTMSFADLVNAVRAAGKDARLLID
ncbi:hypothetical protein AB1Y20_022962 [Prymnesium parvum]|uniref:HMA domain-containing protein n=1 Tax=Prymnesium parvum TaxID=97485 RepID=A0AB34JCM9_PRYPA